MSIIIYGSLMPLDPNAAEVGWQVASRGDVLGALCGWWMSARPYLNTGMVGEVELMTVQYIWVND